MAISAAEKIHNMEEADISCICFHARRAARHITRFFDCHLRAAGLSPAQYTTLRKLSKIGSSHVSDIGRIWQWIKALFRQV